MGTARPRILDLFCKAGGAAMGYYRAGFDVVGIDIKHQPNYPFRFIQADAMEYLSVNGHRFDAVHASPPCQCYAPVTRWRGLADNHPDLVSETRCLLQACGRAYAIENVTQAPLLRPAVLCGSMFGLRVIRHRAFETSFFLTCPSGCRHTGSELPFMHKAERAYADAMGCGWMGKVEAREAIPPAYTCHVGRHLLQHLRRP